MLYIFKILAKKPSMSYQIMADYYYNNCEKVLKYERFQKVREIVYLGKWCHLLTFILGLTEICKI